MLVKRLEFYKFWLVSKEKYSNKWNDEIFEIKSHDGVGYRLHGKNGKFFRWQLSVVNEPTKNTNNIKKQLKEASINNKLKRELNKLK